MVPVGRGNFSKAIAELISLLYEKEIDSFVMDKYEMMLYYDEYNNNTEYRYSKYRSSKGILVFFSVMSRALFLFMLSSDFLS